VVSHVEDADIVRYKFNICRTFRPKLINIVRPIIFGKHIGHLADLHFDLLGYSSAGQDPVPRKEPKMEFEAALIDPL